MSELPLPSRISVSVLPGVVPAGRGSGVSDPQAGHCVEQALVQLAADRLPALGAPDLDAVEGADDHGVTLEACVLPEPRRQEDASLRVGLDLDRAGRERPNCVVRRLALADLLGQAACHLTEALHGPDAEAVL